MYGKSLISVEQWSPARVRDRLRTRQPQGTTPVVQGGAIHNKPMRGIPLRMVYQGDGGIFHANQSVETTHGGLGHGSLRPWRWRRCRRRQDEPAGLHLDRGGRAGQIQECVREGLPGHQHQMGPRLDRHHGRQAPCREGQPQGRYRLGYGRDRPFAADPIRLLPGLRAQGGRKTEPIVRGPQEQPAPVGGPACLRGGGLL